MLYIMLFLIILLIIFIIYYIVKRFQKFSFIKNINNKLLKFIISILPILILFLLFNFVNFAVIIIHLAIFMLLSELIIKLIKMKNKKEFNRYYAGITGILLTIVYLGLGAYLDYHVNYTYYEIKSAKEIGDNFRIIQISDSHIGATFDGNGFKKHMEKLKSVESDIVVVTGDFVDDDTTKEDMIDSVKALSILNPKYGIYMISGNHDKGYFNTRNFTYDDMKEELNKYNIKLLEDEIIEINDYISLIGRKDRSDKDRKSIDELVSNLNSSKYIIDLNHQPNDYKNEMNKVDLVLSGHTHGGQLFPLGYIGLLMGSNDEFYGLHKRENTNFIVNSGISDWAIDFKTGTFSEIGIIDIKSQ